MDIDRLRALAGTEAPVQEASQDDIAMAMENFMEGLLEQGHDPHEIRDSLLAMARDIEQGVYDVDYDDSMSPEDNVKAVFDRNPELGA